MKGERWCIFEAFLIYTSSPGMTDCSIQSPGAFGENMKPKTYLIAVRYKTYDLEENVGALEFWGASLENAEKNAREALEWDDGIFCFEILSIRERLNNEPIYNILCG